MTAAARCARRDTGLRRAKWWVTGWTVGAGWGKHNLDTQVELHVYTWPDIGCCVGGGNLVQRILGTCVCAIWGKIGRRCLCEKGVLSLEGKFWEEVGGLIDVGKIWWMGRGPGGVLREIIVVEKMLEEGKGKNGCGGGEGFYKCEGVQVRV